MLAPLVSSPTGVVPFGPGASDFTIAFSSSAMTLAAGASGSTGVTLTSVGGFSGLILISSSTFLLDASLDKQNVTLSPSGSASATLTVVVPITTTPGNYTVSVNGVYGCSTLHTKDIVVTVTGPDFSISLSKPILSMTPGGVDSSLITLTSLTGFSGLVSLVAYPSGGLGPSLSPASVPVPSGGSGSSNLTVFAPPSTLPGNYTVELIASSGSLVHFTEVLVTVIGPGFTAYASPSFLEVAVSGSNSSVITVKPFGGFTGVVTFYNSSSPPGLEAVFAPPSVALPGLGTSTLTVSAPPGTSLGFHFLTVVAVNPTFNATIDMPVFVGPDFGISASPEEISLIAGGSSCSSTVTVTALNGFTGLVTLANSTFTLGLTVTISTTSITTSGTATLTISAPASTVPGFYYIIVDANSTSASHSASVIVNVTGPDFSLSASPSSVLIDAPPTGNTNKNSTVTITSLQGFSGNVSLGAYVAGANMTATVNPVNVTSPGTATLTVAVGNESISGFYDAVIVGTSGPLTHTIIVSVTVVAPDFSINASPTTISIDTFTPGTSTITIDPLNGFTGTVDLFIYAPLEVNATITPASITGSGTATLSVNSTVPGTYTVEIDGFSGFLFHPTFVSVTVVGPDFSIASFPATLPVPVGFNVNSTISVTGLNGFSGSVNVTAIAPFGLSASLNVSSITPSTTAKLTVTVAPDTPAGTYYVDVVGTSGALTHTAIVTIQVSDFTLSASPSSLTILVGTSRISVITIGSLNGFSGTVTLFATASGGLTPTWNATSFIGSGHAQLTITASSTILPGTYLVNVTATSGSLSHTTTITVVIPVPDFSITATTPVSVYAGATGNSTVTISPISGLSEDVTLSFSSSAGLSCSLSSATVTGASGTSTLSCSGLSGTYTVTVTGTSSSAGPHTATVTVSVIDFTISAGPVSPSQKSPSLSGSSTITLTGLNGFAGTIALSVSTSTPSGLTCSPLSTAVFGTTPQAKTLSCSASVVGDYTVTVTGTIGSLSHVTASILFHVTDFTVTASPTSGSAIAGASASSTITVAPVNSFTGTVALSYSSSPSGLTCTLTPSSLTMGLSQTSALSCSGSTGVYTVTVTGTSGSRALTATVTITIEDFSVTASPTTASVATGASATSTITVSFLNSFTGTVSLSESASPSAGITCSLTSSSLTSPGTSTLSCLTSASGTFTVTVTGTSGLLSHTTSFAITSSTPNFTITASPTSLSIQAGGSGSTTISIAPLNGFSGAVTLSAASSPTGPTSSFSTTSISGGSGSSTLTINVDSSIAPATYTITIQGTSGSLSNTAQVTLTVTAASTGSNILGLPSTTFYGIIIVIVIAAVGAALYFMRVRKKAP